MLTFLLHHFPALAGKRLHSISSSHRPPSTLTFPIRLTPPPPSPLPPPSQLLKPAHVVLVDSRRRTILVVLRGTHSHKDRLTCATAAGVPFHHTLLTEAGVRHIVLGYAHCGMVAAARALAAVLLPVLRAAIKRYPGYHVKVRGRGMPVGVVWNQHSELERLQYHQRCCCCLD